jgi:hypothetical protein
MFSAVFKDNLNPAEMDGLLRRTHGLEVRLGPGTEHAVDNFFAENFPNDFNA